jgi:hypothetical protein
MAISSGSEAEQMVWQAERMDERGRLARDWHQLLALYGFMALYGFLSLLFGSLWLSRLFMVGGEMVQWPKYFYPLILMKIRGWIEYD